MVWNVCYLPGFKRQIDMCGIAGYIGLGDEKTLQNMISCIGYRGPDLNAGFCSDEVGLAHARLAIIDLSPEANQPMFNQDRSIAIVFNGEIYNFLELRKELEKEHQYKFRTNSDTEVLIALYQCRGERMFQNVNGMFAFALYDFSKKQLLLARDRMGKKPLYYSLIGNTLIFGSEVKAILKHPNCSREFDFDALNSYLTFEYVPTPNTLFRDIKKLEPGSTLVFKEGKILSKKKYWTIQFGVNSLSFEEARNQFDVKLNQAVKDRLLADVPLGVFLSGGLDSSTVAYYAQRNSAAKIKTFSVGFEDKSFDESDYANLVAKHLETDHHVAMFTTDNMLSLIPEVFNQMDDPLADPSLLPTHLLSRYTRAHVTVALGGDGSDELLAGYPTFFSDRFIPVFANLPKGIINMLMRISDLIPVRHENMSLDFKIRQFLRGFESKPEYVHTLWLGSFTPREKNNLFSSSVKPRVVGHGLGVLDELEGISRDDAFNQLLYNYCSTYLLDDILVKVDRASMLASLEVRAPFLDYRIVEFLNSLPRSYKIRGSQSKIILKDLMKDKLPAEIVNRSKKGFGIPLSRWLRKELRPLCEDLLSESTLSKHGFFDLKTVSTLKHEHFSQKRNHRKTLWTLMVFHMWLNQFGR